MICIYCNKLLQPFHPDQFTYYVCRNCCNTNIRVEYLVDNSSISTVFLFNHKYEIHFSKHETFVLDTLVPQIKIICHFPFVIKISPCDFESKLNRLLNLKTFS